MLHNYNRNQANWDNNRNKTETHKHKHERKKRRKKKLLGVLKVLLINQRKNKIKQMNTFKLEGNQKVKPNLPSTTPLIFLISTSLFPVDINKLMLTK